MTFQSIVSQDTTDDFKENESSYINKIDQTIHNKNSVENTTKQDDTTQNTDKQNNDKSKYSIGYFSYIKIIIVLIIVILLIYGLSILAKKYLKIKGNSGEQALILSNQSLGPGKWIQIVYIAGKFLILGITNENVSLITEVTDPKEKERLEIALNEIKIEKGSSFIDSISNVFKNILHKKSPIEKFDYEKDSVDFLKKQNDRLDKFKDE